MEKDEEGAEKEEKERLGRETNTVKGRRKRNKEKREVEGEKREEGDRRSYKVRK